MIRREWLRYYEKLPERTYRTKVIQSWDTAAKDGAQNDWSVCTTWLLHDKHYYLMDLIRGRYEYPRLRDTAIALAERFQPDIILIEEASTGIALAQELRSNIRRTIKPIPVDRDKVGRLYVQQQKFEAGRVLFPKVHISCRDRSRVARIPAGQDRRPSGQHQPSAQPQALELRRQLAVGIGRLVSAGHCHSKTIQHRRLLHKTHAA